MRIAEFRIIFIGGIHGVGKSVFSEKASRLLKIPYLSASRLITGQKNSPAAINKRVDDVDENQDALISAIQSQSIDGDRFMLDGHFCVLDSNDSLQKIPFQTFQALAPIAAIILVDKVDHIKERLRTRDGQNFSPELLNRLQETELEHANDVCSRLKIPLCRAAAMELENAIQFAATQFAQAA